MAQQLSMASLIWFILVDETDGRPFKGSTADAVSLSPSALIAHFRHAVKATNTNNLSSVDANDLIVYKTHASFDNRTDAGGNDEPLEEDSTLVGLGTSKKDALVVVVPSYHVRINQFLSNTLGDIDKRLSKPSTTGSKWRHPKTPRVVGRWDDFLSNARSYEYPSNPVGSDVTIPATTGIMFILESDVKAVISSHLSNLNRIFAVLQKPYKFQSKATSHLANIPGTATQLENDSKFIGDPDHVLTLSESVGMTFIEDKTPNDLPVRHRTNGNLFDLLDIYKEDLAHETSARTRGDIGRTDVSKVIEQVYGYLAVNNLMYGCLTCYDVTYFLWRPRRGTLLISHPIYNDSRSPSLLQSLYYFTELVFEGYTQKQQTLEPRPKGSDMPVDTAQEMHTNEIQATHTNEIHESQSDETTSEKMQSDSWSNYSSTDQGTSMYSNADRTQEETQFHLNLSSLHSGTVVGCGATGQVIRLKDSNIVVKHCDSYNNPDGFEMLQNEIRIYKKLSKLNLTYVPRYYGECEIYGQHFIALEYISGTHCDWTGNTELGDKVKRVIRDLKKSAGVVHEDVRPENVLITREGDIKLIDFGKARMKT